MKKLLIPLLLTQTIFAMEQNALELNQLPHEIREEIMSYADALTLGHLKRVSKKNNRDVNELVCNAQASKILKWAFNKISSKELIGHTGTIRAVATSNDNNFIVSGSSDCSAKVWDTKTGTCRHTLSGHSDVIRSIAISSDDRFVVTASEDNTAKIWDALSGECLFTLASHTDWITWVEISSDNSFVVTVSDDATAKIWDMETGVCLHTLTGHTRNITELAITSDNLFILTGSLDETGKIWDVKTGKCLKIIEYYNESRLSLSVEAHSIIGYSSVDSAKVWSARSGININTNKSHFYLIHSIAMSSDGSLAITRGSNEKSIRLFDYESCRLVRYLPQDEKVGAVAISSDLSFIVTGSQDYCVRVWLIDNSHTA